MMMFKAAKLNGIKLGIQSCATDLLWKMLLCATTIPRLKMHNVGVHMVMFTKGTSQGN